MFLKILAQKVKVRLRFRAHNWKVSATVRISEIYNPTLSNQEEALAEMSHPTYWGDYDPDLVSGTAPGPGPELVDPTLSSGSSADDEQISHYHGTTSESAPPSSMLPQALSTTGTSEESSSVVNTRARHHVFKCNLWVHARHHVVKCNLWVHSFTAVRSAYQ